MYYIRTKEEIKQDKIKHDEQERLCMAETLKRMEAGIPYPECLVHQYQFENILRGIYNKSVF